MAICNDFWERGLNPARGIEHWHVPFSGEMNLHASHVIKIQYLKYKNKSSVWAKPFL